MRLGCLLVMLNPISEYLETLFPDGQRQYYRTVA